MTALVMLLYSAALTVALLLASPFWLWRMATTHRYREGLCDRLGLVPASLRAFAQTTSAQGKQIIWLHAVSVGETLAATRLIAELEAALPTHRIVISTTTRTGQTLARERFGTEGPNADQARVFYMPLDFAFAIRAYLRVLQPTALILMESELWPRLLHECRSRNIPIAVVNARSSDRSFARALKARSLWKHLLRLPTLWLTQSEEDTRRLLTLGARPGTVHTTGNLKYDIRAPKESRIAELIHEEAEGRPIVVAGSTVASTIPGVDDEEAQVLYGWMKGALPSNALLVMAPRHPERFQKAWEIVRDFPAIKATALSIKQNQLSEPRVTGVGTVDIILLDTIGDLAAVYGIADVAYIGGSMMQRGGHNPLEPAQFAVPTLMGSSYENFRDIVEAMLQENAIQIVKDEIELDIALENLLTHPDQARALGQRGRAVYESQQGATARTVTALVAMIQGARS